MRLVVRVASDVSRNEPNIVQIKGTRETRIGLKQSINPLLPGRNSIVKGLLRVRLVCG